MIWLTWRQQRLEALIGGALLALLAVFLLVTGLDMASTYQRLGVAACLTSHTQTCGDVIAAFRNRYGT
jgi:CDP-diglyceride synthetase